MLDHDIRSFQNEHSPYLTEDEGLTRDDISTVTLSADEHRRLLVALYWDHRAISTGVVLSHPWGRQNPPSPSLIPRTWIYAPDELVREGLSQLIYTQSRKAVHLRRGWETPKLFSERTSSGISIGSLEHFRTSVPIPSLEGD